MMEKVINVFPVYLNYGNVPPSFSMASDGPTPFHFFIDKQIHMRGGGGGGRGTAQ